MRISCRAEPSHPVECGPLADRDSSETDLWPPARSLTDGLRRQSRLRACGEDAASRCAPGGGWLLAENDAGMVALRCARAASGPLVRAGEPCPRIEGAVDGGLGDGGQAPVVVAGVTPQQGEGLVQIDTGPF
jgi:hypothetical protein